MGRVGDQTLTGQNQRLAEQARTGTPVHLFEVFRQNAYVYVGEVRLTGEPRRERQLDDEANERWVYVFPLALVGEAQRPVPDRRDLDRIEGNRRNVLSRASVGELVRRARLGGREQPGTRQTVVAQFERNLAVAELAKRLAEGRCDLCREPAPFSVSRVPYLECHHVVHLAQGGADTIENAVALCPNCHRRMHALDLRSDRERLLARIAARDLVMSEA
ncbi:HNH endonuclease [Roseomonas sp. HJA6]|uniref:HNH endonuclease n=2 Tax=Roseomonas alba TaxID=2846776 RepID=A0ABS7ACB9_9PROT|nr:HNH endonuclease [Neoroseomonas alba]